MDDIIQAQNLTKTFGTFTAVNDVSFNVPKGEIFAFLGPNGAGKTTTVKMLTTLLRPTAGTIKLNGIDTVLHSENARKTFGIVFQDPSLDDELTAYENMEFHAVLYKVPGKEMVGEMFDPFYYFKDQSNLFSNWGEDRVTVLNWLKKNDIKLIVLTQDKPSYDGLIQKEPQLFNKLPSKNVILYEVKSSVE